MVKNTPLNIDLNADIGESYGQFKIGNDAALIPYLSSCNIACGFHGGDPLNIERTISLALEHGLRIGAHPSYPDLAGFGRRKMQIPAKELKAIIKYQISALKGMVESQGGTLAYVKPHGALYNTAASTASESQVIVDAIQEMDAHLKLMGLAGSQLEKVAIQNKLSFITEAFADRRYTTQGTLLSRKEDGAVLNQPSDAIQQVLSIVLEGKVLTNENTFIPIQAQSICLHGDHPNTPEILKTLREIFIGKGINCGY